MVRSLREKLLARRLQAKGPLVPADEEFRRLHPVLFDLLTKPLCINKRVLEPCRLGLVIGDGDWIVSVNDAVLKQTLAVRAATFAEALQALEEALKSTEQRWSLWRGKEVRLPKGEDAGKLSKKKLASEDEDG